MSYMNRIGVEFESTEVGVGMVCLARGTYSVVVNLHDIESWECGALVQDAFPYLNADEREFLISGMNPTEFAALFTEEA